MVLAEVIGKSGMTYRIMVSRQAKGMPTYVVAVDSFGKIVAGETIFIERLKAQLSGM